MFLIVVIAEFFCGTCGVTALGHRSSLGRLLLRINYDPQVRVCGGFTKNPILMSRFGPPSRYCIVSRISCLAENQNIVRCCSERLYLGNSFDLSN